MAVALKQLYTPQASAVTYGRKYKSPLASIVHAELPAKVEAGKYHAGLDLAEKELAQNREQFEKSYDIESSTLDLERSKFESGKEAAKKAEGIQAAGLGLTAGISLNKMYKDYLKDKDTLEGTGAKYAGTVVGPVTGFGVGYGVKKMTGSTTKGVAAGVGAGLAADYLARGSESVLSSIWDLATGWWE